MNKSKYQKKLFSKSFTFCLNGVRSNLSQNLWNICYENTLILILLGIEIKPTLETLKSFQIEIN